MAFLTACYWQKFSFAQTVCGKGDTGCICVHLEGRKRGGERDCPDSGKLVSGVSLWKRKKKKGAAAAGAGGKAEKYVGKVGKQGDRRSVLS